MRRIAGTLFIAAVTAGVLACSAHAAVLTASGKNVQIDAGAGIWPAGPVTTVQPGTTIYVGRDSAALIQYPNGCTVAVNAGETVSVATQPPPCKQVKQQAPSSLNSAVLPVLVGVGIAGGVAAIAGAGGGGGSGKKKPASP